MEIILLVILIVFLIVFGIILFTPSEFTLTRRAVFSERAHEIYPYLIDMNKITRWSPWAQCDHAVKHNVGEETKGAGASISWQGTRAGKGTLKVLEALENRRVLYDIQLVKPLDIFLGSTFMLDDDGNQTTVVWSFMGRRGPVEKVMNVIFTHDRMLQGYLDQGFSFLKTVVAHDKYKR